MKRFGIILKRVFFQCGLEDKQFDLVKGDLHSANYRFWRSCFVVVAAIFSVLFIRSFIIGETGFFPQLYGLISILFLIFATLFIFVLKKNAMISQALIFVSFAILYACAIWMNAITPEKVSVVFIVMLVSIPMSIYTGLAYNILVSLIASLVYGLVIKNLKTPEAFSLDLFHIIVYGLLGLIVSVIKTKLKVRDIVHIKRAIHQRDIDDLTGLANKAALMKKIGLVLSQGGSDSIMVVLDIDHFKLINDNYGHSYGDLILAKLGAFLKNKYSEKYVIGRFGGDEFIIFMNNTKDLSLAEDMAKDIIGFVNENIKTPNRNEVVGICAGIARSIKSDRQYDDLFKRADIALYQSKESGRNQYSIYDK